MSLPQAMKDDPSLLDAVHLMLCEWAADELRGAESSDEGSVAILDDAADTVCLEGGRIDSAELYACRVVEKETSAAPSSGPFRGGQKVRMAFHPGGTA